MARIQRLVRSARTATCRTLVRPPVTTPTRPHSPIEPRRHPYGSCITRLRLRALSRPLPDAFDLAFPSYRNQLQLRAPTVVLRSLPTRFDEKFPPPSQRLSS
ncbi:hypothetical protein M8818_000827 [Zalaria obscura]|uniref:Uncharacterized protein n=1 Tax=Zalaria obscura TaxID=2024903 RepID=A0ACC3SNA2_9PEZI